MTNYAFDRGGDFPERRIRIMNQQENIEETKMDEQLSRLFATHGWESAPADFTEKLLLRLEQEKESPFSYKPVISKGAWTAIGLIALAILFISLLVLPDSGSAPVVLQKLGGIFSFQFLDEKIFHFSSRILQDFSNSQILLSALAVTVVIGWHYLFLRSRDVGKRNKLPGIQLF